MSKVDCSLLKDLPQPKTPAPHDLGRDTGSMFRSQEGTKEEDLESSIELQEGAYRVELVPCTPS